MVQAVPRLIAHAGIAVSERPGLALQTMACCPGTKPGAPQLHEMNKTPVKFWHSPIQDTIPIF